MTNAFGICLYNLICPTCSLKDCNIEFVFIYLWEISFYSYFDCFILTDDCNKDDELVPAKNQVILDMISVQRYVGMYFKKMICNSCKFS